MAAEYAWKDLEVVIMGRPLVRILDVQYKTTSTKTQIFGRGNKALGVQIGNETCEGSLTIGQSELEAMQQKASQLKPGGKVTDLVFDINIAYIQEDAIVRDRIVSATITEVPKNFKQNDPAMEVTIPFIAQDVQYNI